MYLWCFNFVFHIYAFILLVPMVAFLCLYMALLKCNGKKNSKHVCADDVLN
uniref:Uncharacterized protein n=1 Tax=Arundo donax TaxID=35708 RepID=A0A0A8YTK7_ARUDO